MTTTSLAGIREQLEERLRELTERAEHIEEDMSQPHDSDSTEYANETEDDEVRLGVGDICLHEIHDVRHALLRIDEGSYGTCEVCKREIPATRLAAVPYTSTCVNCASE